MNKADNFFKNFFLELENVVDSETEELLDELADELYDDIIMRVPVDTGELMESIEIESEEGHRSIYTDKEYAIPVEVGTFRTEAQPYFEPAYNDLLASIDGKIDVLSKKIDSKL